MFAGSIVVVEVSESLGVLLILTSPGITIVICLLTRPSKEERKKADEKRQQNEKQAQEKYLQSYLDAEKPLLNAIKRHRPALTRNLERAIIKNDYGAIVQNNTLEVIDEFLASIDMKHEIIDYSLAVQIILDEIEIGKLEDLQKGFDPATIPTDGFEFEHWVAENLNQFGWDAKATSGSGDQGIDVIATKDGKTVGLQCKLFSSPVGNKAVQEAHAGKAFHQMDVVGVMSNASYTKSAKALAADTGVKLLSHHDIPNLYEKMFNG